MHYNCQNPAMAENGAGSLTEERSGDAVLNEVLVNRSAMRQVTTSGQPPEVGEERLKLHLLTVVSFQANCLKFSTI